MSSEIMRLWTHAGKKQLHQEINEIFQISSTKFDDIWLGANRTTADLSLNGLNVAISRSINLDQYISLDIESLMKLPDHVEYKLSFSNLSGASW